MAVQLAVLIAKIEADARQFDREMDRVSRRTQELGSTMMTAGRALTIAVTAPIAGLVRTALAFNDLTYRAELSFTTTLKSAQRAKQMLEDLQAFAIQTPFEFPQLVRASQRMLALGFTGREILPTLQAVGDAVAAIGGSQDAIETITYALGQIKTAGHVTGYTMLQLVRNSVPAWDILAKAMGKTTAEVHELTRKGVIPADFAIKALVHGMETRFPGMMQKMGQSILVAMSNLKDAATQTLGALFQPLTQRIVEITQKLATFAINWRQTFDSMSKSQRALIGNILLTIAAIGPLILVVGALARGFALMSSPIGMVTTALLSLAIYLQTNREAMKTFTDFIQNNFISILRAAYVALLVFGTVGVVRTAASLVRLVGPGTAVLRVFLGLLGGVSSLGRGLMSIVVILLRFGVALRTAVAAGSGLSTIVALFASAGGGIAGVLAVLTSEVWVVVAAVVGALALLWAAWQNNWLRMRDILSIVWNGIKVILTAGYQVFLWLAKVVIATMTWLWGVLTMIGKGIGAVFYVVWEVIKFVAGQAVQAITYWASKVPILGTAFIWVKDQIIGALQKIWDAIQWVWGKLGEFFGWLGEVTGFAAEWNQASEIVDGNALKLENTLNGLGGTFGNFFGTVKNGWDEIGKLGDIDLEKMFKSPKDVKVPPPDAPGQYKPLPDDNEKTKRLKELERIRLQIADYLTDLQKKVYDLANEGTRAAVQWDIWHGILAKASPAVQRQALALGQLVDSIQHAKDLTKEYQSTELSLLRSKILLGDESERASLQFELEYGQLKGLDAERTKSLQSAAIELDMLTSLQRAHEQQVNILKQVTDYKRVEKTAYDEVLDAIRENKELYISLGESGARALASIAQENQNAANQTKKYNETIQVVNDNISELMKFINIGEGGSRRWRVEMELMNGQYQKLPPLLKSVWLGLAEQADQLERNQRAAEQFDSVMSSLSDQLDRSQTKLEQLIDPKNSALMEFFGQYRDELNDLDTSQFADAVFEIINAFDQIYDADKKFEQTKAFKEYLADITKDLLQLQTGNEFDRFAASLMKVNEAGELFQPFSDEQLKQMFDAKKRLEDWKATREIIQDFASGVEDIFRNMFQNVMKNGFSSFFQDIISGFDKLLQDMAAKWLASQLQQLFLRGITWLVNQVGGAGTADAFGGFRAMGGLVEAGRPYIVGEHGPELYVPSNGGAIIPNGAIDPNASSSSQPIIQNFYITTPDANSFRHSQQQIMQSGARNASRALKRNGG